METLASGSIDLKSLKIASEEANQYITTIDGGGIKVHDSGNINDYIQITSNGISIYKYNGVNASEEVASFVSDGIFLGDVSKSHLKIDERSMRLIDKDQNTYFYVGDLRNSRNNIVQCFIGDGETTEFYLNRAARSIVSVKVDNVETSITYSSFYRRCTFSEAPANGAKIEIEYSIQVTQEELFKCYILGTKLDSETPGYMSCGMGLEVKPTGTAALSEGYQTKAGGEYSHAEGWLTVAGGIAAHAEGWGSATHANASHAEGRNTTASGFCSHAEGYDTTASGYHSHAEGYYTVANSTQDNSAQPDSNYGRCCHAEGWFTTASGNCGAHAEGAGTEANGESSHAEGDGTKANGHYSHARGQGTIADSRYQTAFGRYNIPDSATDTFIGDGETEEFTLTNAGASYILEVKINDSIIKRSKYALINNEISFDDAPRAGQTVVVKYSLDKYALIIGNGKSTARSNALTVDWTGNIIAQGMAGMIMMFGGTTEPTGWLFCDGRAVSRTTYAELFAAISTNYGAGDGSTTFNLPDLCGKFPLGVSSGHPLSYTQTGSSGGEETHKLTTSEIPGHTHGPGTLNITASGSHAHKLTYETDAASGTAKNRVVPGDDTGSKTGSNEATKTATHTHSASNFAGATAQNTGGGGAHNNMPPYRTVNFIIATGKTS